MIDGFLASTVSTSDFCRARVETGVGLRDDLDAETLELILGAAVDGVGVFAHLVPDERRGELAVLDLLFSSSGVSVTLAAGVGFSPCGPVVTPSAAKAWLATATQPADQQPSFKSLNMEISSGWIELRRQFAASGRLQLTSPRRGRLAARRD